NSMIVVREGAPGPCQTESARASPAARAAFGVRRKTHALFRRDFDAGRGVDSRACVAVVRVLPRGGLPDHAIVVTSNGVAHLNVAIEELVAGPQALRRIDPNGHRLAEPAFPHVRRNEAVLALKKLALKEARRALAVGRLRVLMRDHGGHGVG